MGSSLKLSIQQVDAVNLCLAKVMAVAEVMAGCGQAMRSDAEIPSTDSILVVLQVLVDEVEKIQGVMEGVG